MGGTPGGGPNDTDDRIPVPRVINGKIEVNSPFQSFCRSKTVLAEGMCGGPVIVDVPMDGHNGASHAKGGKEFVYGIVDGIIPVDHPNRALRGLVSYIPSTVIQS